MNGETRRQTAQIFQFPTRPKGGIAKDAARKSAIQTKEIPAAQRVEFGSCWYHDEAIEESHHNYVR